MLQLMTAMLLLAGLCWLVGCDGSAQPYQRKHGSWYYDDRPLAASADVELTVLNRRFAKTATEAFYRHQAISGADAASFEALDEHHARDRSKVWHGDTYRVSQDYFSTQRIRMTVLAGADPRSFRLLGQGYGSDGRHLYFDGEPFKVRDAASFTPLDNGFARDRHSGYYLREPVPGSDGASFAVLGAHYARDAQHVFHADLDYGSSPPRVRMRTLTGVTPAGFQVLESGYARNEGQVFWQGQPVAQADAASFTVLSPPEDGADARDVRHRYQRGQRVAD